MPVELPPELAGYWGPIESAAGSFLGIGGAFDAVNAAREASGEGPLTGVDAIKMGQLYSLAVRQRNAGLAIQSSIRDMLVAEGPTADLLRNQAIDASMITETISSGPLAQQDVLPNYKIQFQVNTITEEGPQVEYRWLNMGDQIPQTLGDLYDLVESANESMASDYGGAQATTGFIQIFTV